METNIPKLVHFIWLGSKLTNKHLITFRLFKRMNPGWDINIVHDPNPMSPTHKDVKELVELMNDKNGFYYNLVYSNHQNNYYKSWSYKNDERTYNARLSEALRVYLTNKYGGIYLDFDMEFPNPIPDDILNSNKFFVTIKNGDAPGVTIHSNTIVDHFFFGVAKGAFDDMTETYSPGTQLTLDYISQGGEFIEYSKQNYIHHLWERNYCKTKEEIAKSKKLQILVTQYKETKEVIKPLLDSIALQQGIDFNEVGVIIVNDGYPKSKLPEKFLKSYPFKIDYYLEEHRGVSGTRNSALDHATSDYVMFCDADDMFFSMAGLNLMIAEMDKGFNALTTKFWEEIVRDERFVFTEHKNDKTFVHGKFYRRQYLVDYNIRFNDKLTVHEDSYFNYLATTLSDDKSQLKYSDVPVYLWRWRKDSVCRHDPLYMQKTYKNYIDSITELVHQLSDRGLTEHANLLMCTQMFDTYYLMNTESWLNQDNQEYKLDTEKRFKKFYDEFVERFNALDNKFKMTVSNKVRASKLDSMEMENMTFKQWIEYIKNL